MKYTDIHTGLTSSQVEESRRLHGSNELTPPKRDAWWKLLLSKFTDPLIIILLVAVVISFIPVLLVPGHSWIESAGILGAVLLATTVSFVNEYRANKEFDILNKVNDVTPVRVVRDGKPTLIPKNELVVGDILMLETGAEIPADAAVLESVAFRVNQSSLTGESEPVLKHSVSADSPAEENLPGAYPDDIVLRGTLVTEGHAVVCVTRVGDATEIGKVARAATTDTGSKSPLALQLDGLCKAISIVGSTLAFILFAGLVIQGHLHGTLLLSEGQWYFFFAALASLAVALLRVWYPILCDLLAYLRIMLPRPALVCAEGAAPWMKCIAAGLVLFAVLMVLLCNGGYVEANPGSWLSAAAANQLLLYFMIAITLIVVSVPEGLPMSVTLSLAYSMRKMVRQNCLVRRMEACETIGAATVICSDKTGTLTMNRMSVREALFPEVSDKKAAAPVFPLMSEAIAANSTADLDEKGNVLGNVTEGAMLLYLRDNGVDYAPLREQATLLSQLPFSTQNKFMASCVASPLKGGAPVLYIKGAPEIIIERCSSAFGSPWDEETRANIRGRIVEAQRRAMRVLGLACRELSGEAPQGPDAIKDAAQQLTWLGCFVIQDPVRPDVPDAVKTCLRAGVGVKIVTGDNFETACQIGREIGLLPEGELPRHAVMTGTEFGQLSDSRLEECVDDLRVLSRAKPMDKMRLVNTLQKKNHVVAVTGDGTNDAPALNHADVGLSMGITGTSVAKEASDIVLLDDSFTSITRAVMWGRSLYRNIQKFIVFQLTVNVAACGIAALGPFTGCAMPLTVTQMLWVNLIMDTFAALALATEPPSDDVMNRKPRNKMAFIITPSMWLWILSLGIAFILAAEIFINMLGSSGGVLDARELTMLFTGFVMLQFWNLFNARVYGTNKSFLSGLCSNRSFLLIALVILIGQFLAVQFGGEVFRTVPLNATEWLILIVGTLPVLLIGEIIRFIERLRGAEA